MTIHRSYYSEYDLVVTLCSGKIEDAALRQNILDVNDEVGAVGFRDLYHIIDSRKVTDVSKVTREGISECLMLLDKERFQERKVRLAFIVPTDIPEWRSLCAHWCETVAALKVVGDFGEFHKAFDALEQEECFIFDTPEAAIEKLNPDNKIWQSNVSDVFTTSFCQ